MSAKVVPVSVHGTATLSNIALRASANVPQRHRPNGRVVAACNALADSIEAQLRKAQYGIEEIQRRLEDVERRISRLEAQRLSRMQTQPC